MNVIFRVGDRVRCEEINRVGTVVSVDGYDDYNVKVQFDDSFITRFYTRTGRYYLHAESKRADIHHVEMKRPPLELASVMNLFGSV